MHVTHRLVYMWTQKCLFCDQLSLTLCIISWYIHTAVWPWMCFISGWIIVAGDKSLKKREESTEKKGWALVGQGNCVYHFDSFILWIKLRIGNSWREKSQCHFNVTGWNSFWVFGSFLKATVINRWECWVMISIMSCWEVSGLIFGIC